MLAQAAHPKYTNALLRKKAEDVTDCFTNDDAHKKDVLVHDLVDDFAFVSIVGDSGACGFLKTKYLTPQPSRSDIDKVQASLKQSSTQNILLQSGGNASSAPAVQQPQQNIAGGLNAQQAAAAQSAAKVYQEQLIESQKRCIELQDALTKAQADAAQLRALIQQQSQLLKQNHNNAPPPPPPPGFHGGGGFQPQMPY